MMYTLYGFTTQNTLKALYVLEELAADYEFKYVDLFKGEHKQESFLKLNPVGKVPVLQKGDEGLFESGAICRYVANAAESPLYPAAPWPRAKVDQWLDFFSIHLGKWLSTLYFENVIKQKADLGPRNATLCEEAHRFMLREMAILDAHLAENACLAGDSLTIADLFAFAYIEQVKYLDFSWQDFPHVKAWFDKLEGRDSIQRARKKAAA